MFSIPTLVVAATFVLGQADAKLPESTRSDFDEYCRLWEGRWIGEVTWVADWPGLGKRGEKVTAYYEGQFSDDRSAFLGKFYGGSGSGTLLTVFDAGTKRIKTLAVDSGGGVSETVTYKQDGQWHERNVGSLVDGRRTAGTSRLTISDGGQTHTLTGTGTLGDKPTDPQKDIWRRVSKK